MPERTGQPAPAASIVPETDIERGSSSVTGRRDEARGEHLATLGARLRAEACKVAEANKARVVISFFALVQRLFVWHVVTAVGQ